MANAMAAAGVALRPHAKTHKSVAIARRQIAAGATGITVATASEAAVFAEAGIPDLFIAYPVWADRPRARLLREVRERTDRLRVGVDSVEGARQLGAAMAGQEVEVLVEVDSGDHRTGVRSPAAAADVAEAARSAGLTVVGVFTHGGHGYRSTQWARDAADDEVSCLTAASSALRASGHQASTLSAGSTPTVLRSARAGITEERPGTYVFGDRQQVAIGAQPPESVAAFVLATVVSTAPDRAVLDSGAKILGKDLPGTVEGYGFVTDLPAAVITALYDHHAVVDLNGGPSPRVGQRVLVVPNHVCPVVNLVRDLTVVGPGGDVVESYRVDARGCNV